MKTKDYIDLLRAKTETGTDYAVARYLGISEDAVNQYRKGKRAMSPDTALLIAEKLKIPVLEVLADAQAEHAKTAAMRKKWQEVRKLWAQVTTLGLGVICAAILNPTLVRGELITRASTSYWVSEAMPQRSSDGYPTSDGLTIMRHLWRRLWSSRRRRFSPSLRVPHPLRLWPLRGRRCLQGSA